MTPAERQTIKELLDGIGTPLPSMKPKDFTAHVTIKLERMTLDELGLLCRYYGCAVYDTVDKIVRDKLGKG